MSKFTFIKEPSENDYYDTAIISYKLETVSLDNILLEFAAFLRGCGFTIQGQLDVVEEWVPEHRPINNTYGE